MATPLSWNGNGYTTSYGMTLNPNLTIKSYGSLPSLNSSPASSTTNTSTTGTTGSSNGSPVSSIAARAAADLLSQQASQLFGGADSELGGALGNIFSTGISTGVQTMADNVIKGNALTYGLGKNVGSALSGTAAGLAGNAIGQGIESLGGHSKLSKGIGAGLANGIGTVGGAALSNLAGGKGLASIGGMFSKAGFKTPAGSINPVALGMSMAGAGLEAALGPSKEFAGQHGDITRGFDLAHNLISTGVSFIPGVGQVISGAMALNKGMANLFGSTDGMTKTDATLAGIGEFIAPVKWANTIGKKTTNSIGNESWQKQEARNSFLGGSYGDIGDQIAKGMKKSGKTYGTFSRSQFRNAQKDIAFADRAKSMVEELAKQNEIQDIRSSAMASVNNQRYQQNIQGGPRFSYLGKQGMKILSQACRDLD